MKTGVVVLLALLVIAALVVFIPKGDGDGVGLNIAPANDQLEMPTQITCSVVQDCLDAVLKEDPTATDVGAKCDGTCTLLIDQVPIAGVAE